MDAASADEKSWKKMTTHDVTPKMYFVRTTVPARPPLTLIDVSYLSIITSLPPSREHLIHHHYECYPGEDVIAEEDNLLSSKQFYLQFPWMHSVWGASIPLNTYMGPWEHEPPILLTQARTVFSNDIFIKDTRITSLLSPNGGCLGPKDHIKLSVDSLKDSTRKTWPNLYDNLLELSYENFYSNVTNNEYPIRRNNFFLLLLYKHYDPSFNISQFINDRDYLYGIIDPLYDRVTEENDRHGPELDHYGLAYKVWESLDTEELEHYISFATHSSSEVVLQHMIGDQVQTDFTETQSVDHLRGAIIEYWEAKMHEFDERKETLERV